MKLYTTISRIVYLLNSILWMSIGYGVFVQFTDYILSVLFLLIGVVIFPPVLSVVTRRLKTRLPLITPFRLCLSINVAGLYPLISIGFIHSNAL